MDAITEKYASKVTPEYRAAFDAVFIARMMLTQHREQYEALLKAKQDMDNFGGLIDPTLYRDMLHSKNFERQLRAVEAAIKFLDVVDGIAAEAEAAR